MMAGGSLGSSQSEHERQMALVMINASFINAPLLQDQQMIDVRCPLPVDDAISMSVNPE